MHKTVLALATATAGLVYAQTPADVTVAKPRTMMWEQKVEVAGAPQEATIGFLAAEGAVGLAGKTIKGAPYSATVEQSFTQTLGDGTRIQRKSTSRMARDSEGRTRTENTPMAAGALAVDLPATVFIFDPVGKQTIVLNEKEKTARVLKMPSPDSANTGFSFTSADGQTVTGTAVRRRQPAPVSITTSKDANAPKDDVLVERHVEVIAGGPGPHVVIEDGGPAMPVAGVSTNQHVMVFRGDDGSMKSESLGTQTVSGVACAAKRSTRTIAAGQIGNDRPIEIVNETCFSEELKLLVSSRTNDPMHGENSMRLTSISRTEPAKSLFEVPAGYTVKEGPQPMILERKFERK